MSQIMNHREIEYFTKKYWSAHDISFAAIKDMILPDENSKKLLTWLDDTSKAVFQDDLCMDYGLDCLRCYLMFEKTPKADDKYFDTWDEGGLEGVYKFISKYRRMILTALSANAAGKYSDVDVTKLLSVVDKMEADCQKYMQKDNTLANRHNILSVLMEGIKTLQNELQIKEIAQSKHQHEIEIAVPHYGEVEAKDIIQSCHGNSDIYTLCKRIIVLMAPFVPYISEELFQAVCLYENDEQDLLSTWYTTQKSTSVLKQKWTAKSIDMEREDIHISIPVQVNARTRRVMNITSGMTREQVEHSAKNEIEQYLTPGKDYQVIYVPDKLINFVIK